MALIEFFEIERSEKACGLRFVVSHPSAKSADGWGTAVLGYFMTGPPAHSPAG